ncbi:FMN-dependent dehydrogenase [Actinomyces massiliensis]|jgi:hypothetical protein|uniref:FMN-dependent dehydrogenase n=1 Tax=Actinomyces massiliensis F0489 TaxID=1125718 RepID=J0NJW6_9ACTO|nr:hypothetical protein [Actinomyces massiliensis]EJF47424.1 hypothetical protein HMPREF1318_1373 [Actinomyces massiliensis F0489]WLD72584.1 FMN-dependent dehydrogenase [Actinomyces massiliensis]
MERYGGAVPSYRTILTVASLRPGRAPGDVEAAARAAVGETTVLEAFQVGVVRGEPRVTVRFTGADDAEARAVHDRVVDAVRAIADAPRALLVKVVAGRSVPVA